MVPLVGFRLTPHRTSGVPIHDFEKSTLQNPNISYGLIWTRWQQERMQSPRYVTVDEFLCSRGSLQIRALELVPGKRSLLVRAFQALQPRSNELPDT